MKQAVVLSAVLLLLCFAPIARSEETSPSNQMDNVMVARMVKSGIAQDLIVVAIAESEPHFHFDSDSLMALRQTGVPDQVVRAMIARQHGQPILGFEVKGRAVAAAVAGAAPANCAWPCWREPKKGPQKDVQPIVTASIPSEPRIPVNGGVPPAKATSRIEIEVVDTSTSERQFTYSVPGTAGQSSTTCDSSATAINLGGGLATANGNTNCNTTTTPGAPARTVVRSIPQAHVHAIMPDGTQITLWCQQSFRRCSTLSAGTYPAEVDGNSVWVYGHELGGKEHKVKYHYVGGW